MNDTSNNPLMALFRRLTHSPLWPIIVLAYIAYVTYEVTAAPRSLALAHALFGGLALDLLHAPSCLAQIHLWRGGGNTSSFP